jgi:hypothetical protein
VTPARLPGSPLDLSVQNEADHAVRQAVRWLADRQQPDGSFGETNRVALTSLALFALSASRQPGLTDPCSRAALWLSATETNRIDALDAHAWRLLALSLVLPESAERAPFLRRLAARAPADGTVGRAFWDEALAQSGLAPPPPPDPDTPHLLARAAALWPAPFADARAAWRFARLVNRSASGQLLRGQTPIDWRRQLAARFINTQKTDPRGGGFWPSDAPDGPLAETAYALLCLLEL